jgi:outer membrane cobalamin receptor
MKLIFTLLFSITVLAGFSQTLISGTVSNTAGERLPQANIILTGTYDGSSSDSDGKFQFTTTESGIQIITVKYIGYKKFQKEVTLTGEPVVLSIQLDEEFNQLEAVTISAGAFTAGDASRRTIFRAVDIATTAGATADIAGALNTLPGTQKVGESGRLFVRGGDSNEARTFIDGMLVLDAYGPTAPNTPSRGRFLPFMFKGTSFSTGGYSAEYGQALSSALVLDSKDEEKTTRTDIGILSVGGDVAHSQAWENGSAAAKIEYTDIRPYFGLINQRVDWKDAPVSLEGSGAFRQKIGKDGMAKIYGNFSRSTLSLYNHSIDDYDIKDLYDLTNNYRYVNLSYKDPINTNWLLRGGVSYTSLKNDVKLGPDNSFEKEAGVHAKIAAEGSLTDHIELKTGVEFIDRKYDEHYSPEGAALIQLDFRERVTAAFAEIDLYAGKNFVTRIGARGEHNNLIGQLSIDPRISLAYKTGGNGQMSFAYGTFRQSPKNKYVRINTSLDPEKASHYILNYQIIENNKTFRVEAYYKKYDQLVKFIQGDQYNLNNGGSGYARGIELFWRDNKSLKNVDYWVSYSYLDTQRDYLNFPNKAIPSFASSHNLSLVYKHFVRALNSQLGTTYSYTTGRPYNDPNEERFNNGRTPSYQDLSFNWSYLPKPYLIIYFSCTNILGRDNVFGYEYSDEKNSDGLYNERAVRQPASRFLFVGIFITLSKDKSVNQLPSL